jgi:hypothetical protein
MYLRRVWHNGSDSFGQLPLDSKKEELLSETIIMQHNKPMFHVEHAQITNGITTKRQSVTPSGCTNTTPLASEREKDRFF